MSWRVMLSSQMLCPSSRRARVVFMAVLPGVRGAGWASADPNPLYSSASRWTVSDQVQGLRGRDFRQGMLHVRVEPLEPGGEGEDRVGGGRPGQQGARIGPVDGRRSGVRR